MRHCGFYQLRNGSRSRIRDRDLHPGVERLGARYVIACEPSAAMRQAALEKGLASNISILAGRAEQFPLVQESLDIVWLSTVVHHISDLATWAADTVECSSLAAGS